VIRAIESQTDGRMKVTDFRPPSAENAYCSFNGNFVLMEDGKLKSLTQDSPTGCCCQPQAAVDTNKKAQAFVAKRWSAPQSNGKILKKMEKVEATSMINVDSLDAFLDRSEKYFLAVSGMAFQDVWNLDLERLRDCFIHVFSPDRRVIPFCAYNMTDCQGKPLYRSGVTAR
jgi:7,8-dihydro-6-hydroxymethylpterin dimethyltransferase